MSLDKEFNPGFPPDNPDEEVSGLEQAIKSTEQMIVAYKKSGADVSDLEQHLKSLRDRWNNAENRRWQKAA